MEEPRRSSGPDGRDLHVYGGLLVLGGGLWWIQPPLALIGVGLCLLYLGIWRMS